MSLLCFVPTAIVAVAIVAVALLDMWVARHSLLYSGEDDGMQTEWRRQ